MPDVQIAPSATRVLPTLRPLVRDGWRQFDSANGYTVDYPDGWLISENLFIEGVDVFHAPGDQNLVAIGALVTQPEESLSDLTISQIEEDQASVIRREYGAEPEILARLRVGPTEGAHLRFMNQILSTEYIVSHVVFIDGGHVWLATLSVPTQRAMTYDEAFGELLESFRAD